MPVMVVLPLFLSFPEFILNSMENAYIDRCGQAGQRAAILSVANMAGNLIEIVFLLATAYVAGGGIAACFIGAGMTLVILGERRMSTEGIKITLIIFLKFKKSTCIF